MNHKFILSALAISFVIAVTALGLSLYQVRADTVLRGPSHSEPSVIDGAIRVQKGTMLNEELVSNALLVRGGKVGIVNLTPEYDLDAQVTARFGENRRMVVHDDGLMHYENSDTGSIYYRNNGQCSCDGLQETGGGELNYAPEQNMSFAFMNVLKDIFTIKSAAAIDECYTAQLDCQAIAGCQYCQDQGTSCPSGEFACNIACDSSHTGAPVDASCDSGDILLDSWTGQCFGDSWTHLVKCQSSSGTDYYSKIEFAGSPSAGRPPQTIINDNFVAENNTWGGDSSGCYTVSTGGSCNDGDYVAGIGSGDFTCCPL